MAHLWVQSPAPVEYVEMILCREFGWLPSEMRQQSVDDIHNFLAMMNAETTVQNRRSKNRGKR